MKTIKLMNLVRNVLMVSALVCLAACSSNDDSDNNDSSGKGTAYSTVDERTVKYEHCYIVPYDYNGELRYELSAFNVDPIYYKQHPEKIKEDMLYSCMVIDVPASSINTSATKDFDLGISYDSSLQRILIDDDSDIDESKIPVASTHIWYAYDREHHKIDQSISISKSGNMFKVTSTGLTVLASEKGVDDGISSDARRTSCSFGFESNNIYQIELENAKLVTDPQTQKAIKRLRRM